MFVVDLLSRMLSVIRSVSRLLPYHSHLRMLWAYFPTSDFFFRGSLPNLTHIFPSYRIPRNSNKAERQILTQYFLPSL